jgi:hypothetical protein
MKEFDSEEAAKEAVEKEKTINPKVFCPLVNGMCRYNCVCIGEPYYRKNDQNKGYGMEYSAATKWYLYSWWCSNGMFQGKD